MLLSALLGSVDLVTVTVGSPPTSHPSAPDPTTSYGRRTGRHRPRKLLALIALALAAGLLAAGIAGPFVLGTGLAVKSVSDHFERLPTVLPDPVLGRDSVILDANGKTIATLHGTQNRIPVKIAQVSPIMKTAIVDIEDSRF